MTKKNLLLTTLVIFGLTTISMAQVPAYVPTNGLVGWWPFTGNANDLSGNGNNCTIYNSPTLCPDRNLVSNSAYFLNGTNNWINTNSAFLQTSNPHSISIWWQTTDSTKTNQTLFNTNPHTLENFAFHYSSSSNTPPYGLAFGMGNGLSGNGTWNVMHPDNGQITTPPTRGIWHHAVWVKDASLIWKFYFDGNLIHTFNSNINTGSQLADLRFGAENAGYPTGGANFKGNLDDIGVWNRALTACEINQLYTSGISPITTTTSAATICAGASTTITASGATTYAWMPGNLTGATIIVSPTSTTTYTVTGTSNGCINTATRIITVNPLPVVTATSTAAAVCTGASVTLTGGGATSYTWSGGVSNAVSFIPTATTTYTVTGTNANGCVNTATITITVNPLPVVTATSTAAAVCTGASVTLTGGGATSYSWSGGVTNAVSFIPTATTTYTVTGTNINGCVNTATITVTVNPLPVVTATSTAAAICVGGSVTLTGGGATSYTWSGGVTNAVSFIPTATTTYTVTGTNINGCVNTATITLTVNPLPVVTTTTTASSICIGGNSIILASGASTYNWMPGNLNGASVIVSPISTTTYTVTGTSAAGCVNTATITITVNPLPVVTTTTTASSICIGGNSIILASGATTYNWTPGNLNGASVIVSPISTTTYTVTGTNINGCVNTATISITVNPLPVVTTTTTASSICIGGNSIILASGATTYNWMPGNLNGASIIVAPLATTTYTVTGTSAAGCVNTATITITVNPLPVITATSTAAAVCAGTSVTLTGGGATTYTWDNNVTDAVSFVPTATTTYMVTGTDVNGCVNTAMTTVTVNPLPVVTATSSSASVCTGGSVTLTGGGATTYTWDNNVMDTVSFVPMATTTYMVIGTDANGCVNTAMTTVTVNPLPIVTATSSSAAVCIGASVTLTGGGATTYTWDNNVMDAVSFVPSATTTYMVIGTDANGCVNTAMTTVTVNPLPIVTANSSAASVCTGGSVTLTGGGAATYTWDNNVIDAVSFVPTATTTYMVTGTDVNGCVNTATTTVTLSGLLIISLGPDIIQCGGTALLDAGNMGSTYLWSNASTTQTITVSASGTYIVVVTDVNGCNGSDTAVVTINSNPSVSAAASSSVVCVDDADVSLIGTPIGGVWSGPGVNGLLLNPTAAGVGLQSAVYSYTDVNGCEGMDSVSLQVNACVGLAENILANGVSVYPNPNSGTFIVSVNMNVDELTLEMLDLQGRVVCYAMENNIQSGFTKQINMENVANGVYMLRITTNKEQVTLKVAVQK